MTIHPCFWMYKSSKPIIIRLCFIRVETKLKYEIIIIEILRF